MRRPQLHTDAFVDESIRGQRYYVGCVSIAAKDVGVIRALVGDLAVAGRRVHFNNESVKRRMDILATFAELPIRAFVVCCQRSHGVSEFAAREACLAVVVSQLQQEAVVRLVVESRQDDRADVRLIDRVRAPEPKLVYEHRRGTTEPLLWLADGITWAVGAGGQWRGLIESVLTDVTDVSP